ncbi:MAG: HAD family hydrolase [Deltaproteobacteria bacterium]|jgi:FMN phosphatase YigB (HAD superfamily)|nr:HAD family hydrolase [Deltaproteobacteria bacterium]
MPNCLFTQIDWDPVQAVGFDMDGTLYDEFDFIRQVYPACLEHGAEFLISTKLEEAKKFILTLWLEKGSSYPHIFGESFDCFGRRPEDRETFIGRALDCFRSFRPQLRLPARSAFILNLCRERWPIFLVTDGRPLLQTAKFEALGLADFFPKERRSFTGSLPQGSAKPSPVAYEALNLPYQGREVVFFGDRKPDFDFALNLGFQFVKVAVMQPLPN